MKPANRGRAQGSFVAQTVRLFGSFGETCRVMLKLGILRMVEGHGAIQHP